MYVATETGLWLAPHKCHTHVRAADLLGNTLALVDGDIRIYAQRHKVAAVMKMPGWMRTTALMPSPSAPRIRYPPWHPLSWRMGSAFGKIRTGGE